MSKNRRAYPRTKRQTIVASNTDSKSSTFQSRLKYLPIVYAGLIAYSAIRNTIVYGFYNIEIIGFLTMDELIMTPLTTILPIFIYLSIFTALPHFTQDRLSSKSSSEAIIRSAVRSMSFTAAPILIFAIAYSRIAFDFTKTGSSMFIKSGLFVLVFVFTLSLIREPKQVLERLKKNFYTVFVIFLLLIDMSMAMIPEVFTSLNYVQAESLAGKHMLLDESRLIGQTKNWLFTVQDSTKKVEIIRLEGVHKIFYYKQKNNVLENIDNFFDDILFKSDGVKTSEKRISKDSVQ